MKRFLAERVGLVIVAALAMIGCPAGALPPVVYRLYAVNVLPATSVDMIAGGQPAISGLPPDSVSSGVTLKKSPYSPYSSSMLVELANTGGSPLPSQDVAPGKWAILAYQDSSGGLLTAKDSLPSFPVDQALVVCDLGVLGGNGTVSVTTLSGQAVQSGGVGSLLPGSYNVTLSYSDETGVHGVGPKSVTMRSGEQWLLFGTYQGRGSPVLKAMKIPDAVHPAP